MSDPLYVQPDGMRSHAQIHDEVVAGLSQLMGTAVPEAADVQTSHGAIASAVSTALSGVLGSRQGTLAATGSSGSAISQLLQKAAKMYESGDQNGAATLRAAAETLEGSPPATGGGAGGGADTTGQMVSQVGQQVGQIAQSLTQPLQGHRVGRAAWRAERKQAITAVSSSRWAGAITRSVEDQYQLGMRGLAAHVRDLGDAVAALAGRCALRPGERAPEPADERGSSKTWPTLAGVSQRVRAVRQDPPAGGVAPAAGRRRGCTGGGTPVDGGGWEAVVAQPQPP